jgi:glycosyltransferase involved in cell wall biosynthesis
MKIGFVTPSYPPKSKGGGAKSCKLIVEGLKDQGHDVEVLSFDGDTKDEDFDYVMRKSIESNRFDIRNFRARSIIQKFSEEKEIIHCYSPMFLPAVGSLSKQKTVGTLNNYKFFYPYNVPGIKEIPKFPPYRLAFDMLSRKLIKKIDKFTATSSDVKKYYTKYLDEEKIVVIPEMLNPEFPKFQGLKTNDSKLLYVGAIEEKKGIKDLVKYMENLKEFKLTVVGSGSQKPQIKEIIKNKNLQNVGIKGYIDRKELLECYEKAGWFIHPGKWPEPFGRTIVEAMQMKTPVIATNRGGPKDILPKSHLIESLDQMENKVKSSNRSSLIKAQKKILDSLQPAPIIQRYDTIYKSIKT